MVRTVVRDYAIWLLLVNRRLFGQTRRLIFRQRPTYSNGPFNTLVHFNAAGLERAYTRADQSREHPEAERENRHESRS